MGGRRKWGAWKPGERGYGRTRGKEIRIKQRNKETAKGTGIGKSWPINLGLLLWVTWINALVSVDMEWRLGKVMCQMYSLWRSLAAYCSIANLMIISVDRYAYEGHVIGFPMQSPRGPIFL